MGEVVLVRKKLVYQSPAQLEIIKKMVTFLSTLESEFLIQLRHCESSGSGEFYFYYEYVPLTLEKWILDLGDDILEELEFEMLSLANYLTQHSIRFHFDPSALGLSKDIKVKYFLHEFMIDSERKMLSFKEVEQEIMDFFQDFRSKYKKNEETSTDYTDRKSADSAMLLNRIELISKQRESWDYKSKGLTTDRSKKNLMLSEKIEHSKKKSQEILERLKNMKPHSHE